MDRGDWQAAVYGVTSQTRLSDQARAHARAHTHTHTHTHTHYHV